jgi:predicted GNAT superfamily acetyltransferase
MEGYKSIANYPDLKGIMVEIGSENKHGSSTFLYNYANKKGLKFFTIDCDPVINSKAKSICGDNAILGKGEDVVSQMNAICFAYIDCFDYHGDEAADVPERYHALYGSYGYKECSGAESVRVHLEIARLIEERTADKCLIVVDDTNYHPHSVIGKGAFAVPYLIGRGFNVVEAYEHELFSLAAYVVLYREK